MCGRFTQISKTNVVAGKLSVEVVMAGLDLDALPSYNVAPTHEVTVLRGIQESTCCELVKMKWGLIPSWSKVPNMKFNTINARSEGLRDSPVFRNPFKRTRCVIPADGFFEWKPKTNPKQPFYIYPADRSDIFAFAGLYDQWRGDDGACIDSFTIITTHANSFMETIHHRMPVILDPIGVKDWLDPNTAEEALVSIMQPASDESMAMHHVSPMVNKVTNNIPETIECFEPLEFEF